MNTWRIGQHVPINVYDGDRPVCQCHTAIDAQKIVRSVNAHEALIAREAVPELLGALKRAHDSLQSINGDPYHFEALIADCEAAIAKAEGR